MIGNFQFPTKQEGDVDENYHFTMEVEEQEVRNGGQRRRVSKVRAEIAYYLSHEFGMPMAEIARDLGVCSSAIIKTTQKPESKNEKL